MTLLSRGASIETSIDNRYCRRHKLFLEVEARGCGPASTSVNVYDISTTGLLIESNSRLSLGEMIEVGLPRVGFRMAAIVWTSGQLIGCKFTQPLTQGAVSAARLGAGFPSDPENTQVESIVLEDEAEFENTDTSKEKMAFSAALRVIVVLAVLAWGAIPMIWSLLI